MKTETESVTEADPEAETAVGYIRLSQDGKSLDRQRRDIEDYASERDAELLTIYDEGKRSSGFDTDCPEYTALCEHVDDGGVDTVIFKQRENPSLAAGLNRVSCVVTFRNSPKPTDLGPLGCSLEVSKAVHPPSMRQYSATHRTRRTTFVGSSVGRSKRYSRIRRRTFRSPTETPGTDVSRIGITAVWPRQWLPTDDGCNPRNGACHPRTLNIPTQRKRDGSRVRGNPRPFGAGRRSNRCGLCSEYARPTRHTVRYPASRPTVPTGWPLSHRPFPHSTESYRV